MSHPLTEWIRRNEECSRRELARRVGVNEGTLRAIEAGGGSTLETAMALREATGLPLTAFLPRKGHRSKSLTDPAAA